MNHFTQSRFLNLGRYKSVADLPVSQWPLFDCELDQEECLDAYRFIFIHHPSPICSTLLPDGAMILGCCQFNLLEKNP